MIEVEHADLWLSFLQDSSQFPVIRDLCASAQSVLAFDLELPAFVVRVQVFCLHSDHRKFRPQTQHSGGLLREWLAERVFLAASRSLPADLENGMPRW